MRRTLGLHNAVRYGFGLLLIALVVGGCAPSLPATAVGPTPAPTRPISSPTPDPVTPTVAPTLEPAVPTASPTLESAAPTTAPSLEPVSPVASPTLEYETPAASPDTSTTVLLIRRTDGSTTSVEVEIARTPEERARGLSGRRELPEDHGMLFVFERTGRYDFWMRNTYVPLSIAFIDSSGLVLEIQDMDPLTETLHSPSQPYRYALEVNQGFFERHQVKAGDRVEIPADLATSDG